MKRHRAGQLLATAVLACAPVPWALGSVTWNGSAGTDWANGRNWSNNTGPSPTDTVFFTDTGSSILPADVTSVVNADRTIGGLAFSDSGGHYHTLDLGGHSLSVAGSLSFNLDVGSNTTTTIRDGNLLLTSAFGQINVGRAVSGSATAIADLSGLSSINANVQDVLIGTSTASAANGTLTLSPLNSITAKTFVVGTNGNGTLTLGVSNTILTPVLTIAKDFSNSSVKIVSGGNLALGSANQRTNLSIANQNIGTNDGYGGSLDLSGGTFNAYLGDLTVAQRQTGGFGGTTGTLIGGTGGSVDIGAPGNTANVYIGHTFNGGSSASGTVDFSGLSSLAANVNTLSLGESQAGSAQGTLKLAGSNTVSANSIIIGSNGDANLTLGHSNTIFTPQLTIAKDFSNSSVKFASGGNLTLGSATQRTNLSIADQNIGTNNGYGGTLDLSGGTFTAYLGNLTVGQRQTGGGGGTVASLVGGTGGSVDIGAPGNTANVYIGHAFNAASSASGTVDFSGLGSLTASLNTLSLGESEGGSAQGTLKLAGSNTISANSVLIGLNGDASLTLGHGNTILTPQLTIAKDFSNSSVKIVSGGNLTLGSAAQRTNLSIADQNIGTNDGHGGSLDLTGGTFNAYLGDLTVGQRQTGGFGGTVATLIGGNGGSVDIGATGNTANVVIGHTLNGGSAASGTVDFSGLSSLAAHLNSLFLGVTEAGPAQGTLKLAANSFISANSILLASNGGATLALGQTNTILTPQLIIGQHASNAAVTIPVGGSLTLGSASQPVSLSLATGATNANALFTGTLDLTGATLKAYLDNVVIGNQTPSPGTLLGTVTISSRPDNYIQANSITLGAGQGAGVLNFGGGALIANSIAPGPGTATFNWTGGQLSVGTYGTQPIPFDLNNTGTGTLAPGSATAPVGTTTIFGNYTQGAQATMALDLTGSAPGAGSDVVHISQTATLAGTLSLNAVPGFSPSVGQIWPLATYASRTGTFGFVVPPRLPQDVAFQLNYGATQLVMQLVAPVQQSWVGSSGPLSTASNWNTNSVPGTASSLSITNAGTSPETVSVTSSTTVHRIDLEGTSSPVSLNVPQGIQLGVANQIVVGSNATLSGAGGIYGDVAVNSGGAMHLAGATLNGDVTVASGGTVQLSGTQPNQLNGNISSAGQINVDGSSTANVAGTLSGTGALNVGPSGKVQLAAGAGRSQVGSLSIGTGGVLDLADNSLDIHYGAGVDPAATIAGYLASAYRGGAWDGPGIRSSLLDANHGLGLAHVAAGDLLVAPALYGDTNLDGSVNFTDLLALAQHYGRAGAIWEQGDFNYNGSVGFDDLLNLAQHYGQSSPTAAQLASLSPGFRTDVERAFATVPEPTGLTFAVGAAGLLLRKRRRA